MLKREKELKNELEVAWKKAADIALSNNLKSPKSHKGEIARSNIKKACRRTLEKVGYHKMRIGDVMSEAGMANGLFYHYFPDLKSLVIEVLLDFLSRFKGSILDKPSLSKQEWYDVGYTYYFRIVKSYSLYPGMMQCMKEMMWEEPNFGALVRLVFIKSQEESLKKLPTDGIRSKMSNNQLRIILRALGSIGEEILIDYYITKESKISKLKITERAMAEYLTSLFYQAFFLEHPPIEKLKYDKELKTWVAGQ
ncbi:MAG: TetR/AcrR family transcriptional regulator [Saprospiraceae bacterium]|nr:TetR/AcrR family transcriptional regulator [Bacteroidia bacterium]NNE16424.1 TetR/AcrR family transcriptional regulator [Saprospiraceae bacterium]